MCVWFNQRNLGSNEESEVPFGKMSSKDNFKHFFNGRPPRELIYEDDQCVAFYEEDKPQAPVHFLVVPKKNIPRLIDATPEDEKLLGHLLLVAKHVAADTGLMGNGYHVVVDEDFRAQRLKSLHVFGRALHHMLWSSGPGSRL